MCLIKQRCAIQAEKAATAAKITSDEIARKAIEEKEAAQEAAEKGKDLKNETLKVLTAEQNAEEANKNAENALKTQKSLEKSEADAKKFSNPNFKKTAEAEQNANAALETQKILETAAAKARKEVEDTKNKLKNLEIFEGKGDEQAIEKIKEAKAAVAEARKNEKEVNKEHQQPSTISTKKR